VILSVSVTRATIKTINRSFLARLTMWTILCTIYCTSIYGIRTRTFHLRSQAFPGAHIYIRRSVHSTISLISHVLAILHTCRTYENFSIIFTPCEIRRIQFCMLSVRSQNYRRRARVSFTYV
jgi:hypothetical protein